MANAELLMAPSKEIKLSNCGIPAASPPAKGYGNTKITYDHYQFRFFNETRTVVCEHAGKHTLYVPCAQFVVGMLTDGKINLTSIV